MKATLYIRTKYRDGITCLEQSYYTPPFKVANITEDKRACHLHLMLMNSSPGILDGDEYAIKIEVAKQCSLQLHTQSYQRLFNMKQGACQSMEVRLEKNASLVYLPHPSVPHENSSFKAVNRIYLAGSGNLVWGEILTCGRKWSNTSPAGNGEIFRFSKYRSITEVFINDQLLIKENLLMQPAVVDPATIGQLEGFTHQATLIAVHDRVLVDEQADRVYEYLLKQETIRFGVSTTAGNGLIVRILGYAAEQLHHHLQVISEKIQQQKKEQPVKPMYAN